VTRDLRALAETVPDVLVVGGGIHGACVAWDAVLRGLTVALVEKADFTSATSANSMKIIHGGLRYLQQGDYRRMRQSIVEQRALRRIAPHLVRPLPVVVPAYGHGLRGREALRTALAVNDLVGLDRNAGVGDDQRLPYGRTVSRRECLALVPGLDARGVTGAAIFHDAQVYNSERLVIAFLRSAAKAGAQLANYAEVTGLRHDRDGLLRVAVEDRLTGETLAIRARSVVNASGPWADRVLGLARPGARLVGSFALALNVVTRRLFAAHAVALPVPPSARAGADGRRRSRFLFVVPWREHSLVGTWYEPHVGRADDLRLTEAHVARLVSAIDQACPALALTLDDVRLVHAGLLPLAGTAGDVDERLATRGTIVDHARDGAPGLLSVVGVKYTTARLMAEQAVDGVFAWLGRTSPPSTSAVIPLHGGDRPVTTAGAGPWPGPRGAAMRTLAALDANHGSASGEVLAHLGPGEDADDPAAILRAEVRHGIREEMARALGDVVFRRTELGTAGDPGPEALAVAARAAAGELGWSADRERAELAEVHGRFGVPR
jgi:glycerol-3-phosphate dehydrogenase